MPIQIDWINELILLTSPTTEMDLQTLHDYIEDERGMASPIGLIRSAILAPEGKIEDPTNPGVFSQIILVLQSPWQIQFWGGSGYTRIYGGKIVGGLNDQPMKATGTAGDITVLESPVDGVYVAVETDTSGLTASESAQLDGIFAAFLHRQRLSEGDTNNFVIYEADAVTPKYVVSVVDKDGEAITIPTGHPAERSSAV